MPKRRRRRERRIGKDMPLGSPTELAQDMPPACARPAPLPSRSELLFLADTLRHCLRIIERMCGR